MSKDVPMKFDFGVGDKGETLDINSNPFAMQQLMDRIREERGKVDHLPVKVQRRVWALKNLHKQYSQLEKLYKEEVRQLERKYQKMYDPIFERRAQFAAGIIEPTDAEAVEEKLAEEEDNKEKAKAPVVKAEIDENVQGIPEFWLTVMKNCDSVARTITAEDEDALKHLHDVQSVLLEGDKQGFILSFHFKENPYFTNSVITKTYYLVDEEITGDLIFDHVEATKIDWKQGKNLTVKLVTKKQKSKAGRGRKPQVRTKTVEEPCDSFFRFFSPPVVEEDQELDEDAQEDLDLALEEDFGTGCIFKDKLIRQAVLWFTGEAYDDTYEDFGEDEDGEGDEGDGEDDEEEDAEEEEEEEDPRRRNKGRAGRGEPAAKVAAKPAQGGEPTQQPECKQQ